MSEASPHTSPTRESGGAVSGLTIVLTIAAVLMGGAVFWLQAGLTYSLTLLGSGGLGLQDHLSKAADGLTAGDYEAGEAEYQLARESTQTLQDSLDLPQVEFISQCAVFATAVANWERVVSAADDITAATGELLSL